MRTYNKYINPYMEKILNNEIEHCLEQEEMIKNIVIPVLEREDVYIDEKKIRRNAQARVMTLSGDGTALSTPNAAPMSL